MSNNTSLGRPRCPKCGDETCGFTYELHETHRMTGNWGEGAEAGGSSWVVGQSLVKCNGCDASFSYTSLLKKGLIT